MPKQANCDIEGCDRPNYSGGLCEPHYYRLRRYGNPVGGRPPRTLNSSAPTAVGRRCVVQWCQAEAVAPSGMCRHHVHLWRTVGQPAGITLERFKEVIPPSEVDAIRFATDPDFLAFPFTVQRVGG